MQTVLMYWNLAKSYLRRQDGQGMVEYGLILAVVAVVALAGFSLLGTNINTMLNGIAGRITAP